MLNNIYILAAVAITVSAAPACPGLPKDISDYSSTFVQPNPPLVVPDFATHFVQHKWFIQKCVHYDAPLCHTDLTNLHQQCEHQPYHYGLHPQRALQQAGHRRPDYRAGPGHVCLRLQERHCRGPRRQHPDECSGRRLQKARCLARLRQLQLSAVH